MASDASHLPRRKGAKCATAGPTRCANNSCRSRSTIGIFAGFVPLCNIAGDFPCLNVHPGDLTVLRDAQRYLVGLHTTPIERAILADHDALRSSVIIAEPFTAGGDNMDSGPLLGISAPVPVHLQGAALCELRKIFEARPAIRPAKGYGDQLEAIADENLDRLKHGGDLLLFPRVVAEFAADRFALDECQALHYASEGTWRPVQNRRLSPGRQATYHSTLR